MTCDVFHVLHKYEVDLAQYDLEGLEEAIKSFRYLAYINLFYNNSKHDLQPVLALLNRLLVRSNKKTFFLLDSNLSTKPL